ncbi:Hypothetical protein SRAE_1000019100 [Strongyloides ratti]|uniref:Uncharacterized protein n=1 Tax=Strongyloides ratti TaxID=34506 RepID=A0A090KWM8_STRRB|nr:Hypothetical protein SRAE_1000019100 [Strongyloides ratti]CEF61915.1 Hypothetical protein SRAE_1000019100 [Strongyloides ratti]
MNAIAFCTMLLLVIFLYLSFNDHEKCDKNITNSVKNNEEEKNISRISVTPTIKTAASIDNNILAFNITIINNLTTTTFSTPIISTTISTYTVTNTSTSKLFQHKNLSTTKQKIPVTFYQVENMTSMLNSMTEPSITNNNNINPLTSLYINNTTPMTTTIMIDISTKNNNEILKNVGFIIAVIIQILIMLMTCFVLCRCIHKNTVKQTPNNNMIALDEFNR